MYDLPLYRSWFPFLSSGKIWMNHAAVSPVSVRVRRAVDAYLDRCEHEEIDSFFGTLPVAARLKANLGKLVGSTPDRIAFAPNTSEGLSLLAAGIQWRTGDRILLNDCEFPSNVVPFLNLRRLGVEVDFIKSVDGGITPDQVEALFTPRTRLLSLSFVQFLSGYRADLAGIGEVCRRHGVIFSVDAIQGLGAFSLDVQEMKIDFVSCGGPKWLMGLLGLGFIYVSEALQNQIRQAHAGWMSNRHYFDDFFRYRVDFDETARRYENGTMNLAGIVALCESTTTLLEVGIDNIQNHLFDITDTLVSAVDECGFELLSPRRRERRSGIVSFRCGDGPGLFEELKRNHTIVSLREGMIRISPHFYNSPEEAKALGACLLDYRKSVPV